MSESSARTRKVWVVLAFMGMSGVYAWVKMASETRYLEQRANDEAIRTARYILYLTALIGFLFGYYYARHREMLVIKRGEKTAASPPPSHKSFIAAQLIFGAFMGAFCLAAIGCLTLVMFKKSMLEDILLETITIGGALGAIIAAVFPHRPTSPPESPNVHDPAPDSE